MGSQRSVTLVWYAKTSQGWKRVKPAVSANGRVKPGWGIVDGKPERCPDGRYQLRYFVGRKLVYENAGDNPVDAQAAVQRKRFLFEAKDAAAQAGVQVLEEPLRLQIRKAAQKFIEDAEARGASEAAEINRLVTNEFIASTDKAFIDEITREDILQFHAVLRKRGLSDRTVANKHERLKSFLLFCKVKTKEVMPPAPKYDMKLPTTYTAEEVQAILAAAEGEGNMQMQAAIELGLKCGLREQELMHLEWKDIDFKEHVLRVRSKPQWKFKVKDSEERDIPIPKDLLGLLKALRQKQQEEKTDKKTALTLVLPTASGVPNTKLLRALKRLAKRAELNCKVCDGCQSDHEECQNWQLHKLRRTYCTSLLRSRIDIRTAQAFMGHADLTSTTRYLRPATAAEAQAKINEVQWG